MCDVFVELISDHYGCLIFCKFLVGVVLPLALADHGTGYIYIAVAMHSSMCDLLWWRDRKLLYSRLCNVIEKGLLAKEDVPNEIIGGGFHKW